MITLTLVELARDWKDKKISDKKAKRLYEKIDVIYPKADNEDPIYTMGNGNAWIDVTSDGYLDRKERIKFKQIVGAFNPVNKC